MKTITNVYVAAVLALTLSCEGTKKTVEKSSDKTDKVMVLEGDFVIENLGDRNKNAFEQPLSLRFDKEAGYVNGTTECNGIGGQYTINGNTISFGDIFATKMYCEGKMDAERMMGEALKNTVTFSQKNNVLTFYDKQGNVLLSANKE